MKNRCAELCSSKGIESVERFAELIGVSIHQANNILLEKGYIELKVLERICEVFDVDMCYLLKVE